MKQRLYSGASWEQQAAYCRAVRAGPFIAAAGTTAVAEHGQVVGDNSVDEQAAFVIEKIDIALTELGASLADVIWTRALATHMDPCEGFVRMHKEALGEVDPAESCIGPARLVDPRLLIEIEVEAVQRGFPVEEL